MKTIWKHTLSIAGIQDFHIPAESQILKIDVQNNKPCIWYLCNPENPMRIREISMFGTGHQINDNFTGQYLDTIQLEEGALVFHIFDNGEL